MTGGLVREAIKILENRGFVQVRAGRGTMTAAPTPESVKASLLRLFRDQPIPTLVEMERMLELREVLEETVAGLAAVRATPEDLQRIDAALADMAAGRNVEETIEADLRFHLAVAQAAHNRFFEMVIDLEEINQYFNRAAFRTNAVGTIGTGRRNQLTSPGPGTPTIRYSRRSTRPNGTVTSPHFPRIVQVAARVVS